MATFDGKARVCSDATFTRFAREAILKFIETYSLHTAGNVTRRLGQLPGASELPRLVVTVEKGQEVHTTAEELRRLAAVLDRQG